MKRKNCSLMSRLYYNIIKPLGLYRDISEYFGVFFKINDSSDNIFSDIFHYDYFSSNVEKEFLSKLSDKDTYIKHLNSELKIVNSLKEKTITEGLSAIVSVPNYYSKVSKRAKDFDENELNEYEISDLEELEEFYSNNENNFNIGYKIYVLIYLSIKKRLPADFYWEKNYENQLYEFNREVTLKYGLSSKTSIRTIINLATQKDENKENNIFALYEYADMLFYGRYNLKQDINKAFEIYKSIAGKGIGTRRHPLAFWSLAFIYYNYHQKGTILESCVVIEEIEQETRLRQVEKALYYANRAYKLIGHSAAVNMLGKISLLSENDLPGIQMIKTEYNLKSAEHYFNLAAEGNYVYAYTNLSNIYKNKMAEEKDNNNKLKYLKDYCDALKKAANQNEPWAANRLGLFYLNSRIPNISPKDLPPIESTEFKFSRKIAYEYFKKATELYIDHSSIWAYANIIINFPEKYLSNKSLNIDKLTLDLKQIKHFDNTEVINFITHEFYNKYKRYADDYVILNLLDILK